MKRFLSAYLPTLLAFLVLDGLWLGVLMGPTYRDWLGPLMLARPVIFPAVLFYLIYIVGIVLIGVLPGVGRGSLRRAAGYSALLGLMAYGTYDLTNWATLQGWPSQLALVDWAWGTFASGVAGAVGYWVSRRFSA
ncbi:Uncharacterized membrane protein [Pseudomonas sp. NFACC02]|uniref:DUF2177 family protein n=1 Tax=Pseudomonas sp. NFACC02 TaxID=1566250 RepID=UPI0008B4B586|nr:DUF2177 family protein [Pseudomonas sp. NFACC02]SER31028.1 Uncharacterized membrane protein [Pseudomonas sp. NFACC02]